jgi:GDP-4-dehydro-6-deoxy-D-mannose reductase
MKKILITGISGFVGGHLTHFLATNRKGFEVYGISRSKPAWDFVENGYELLQNIHFHQGDIRDSPRIQSLICDIEPDYILHLAAQSSVAESWKTPASSFINNISGFMNVIETVRLFGIPAKILSVGSAEQYGIVAKNDLPLTEKTCMHPANPYAVARVAQEQLAKIYVDGFGLDICCTRSFNHCGPGQSDRFVVSSIVKQLVMITQGKQDTGIHIGNGSLVRDFLDVRDVVAAYCLLLEKGPRGEVYNICSGRGYAISDIVTILSDIFKINLQIHEEKSQFRPVDNPRIIGSNEKIMHDLGWHPKVPFEDSLHDLYDYWSTTLSYELKP